MLDGQEEESAQDNAEETVAATQAVQAGDFPRILKRIVQPVFVKLGLTFTHSTANEKRIARACHTIAFFTTLAVGRCRE